MTKQQLNKNYYQAHQSRLKTQRKQRYHSQKKQTETQKKEQLKNYYHANSIRVLISLPDYLESSSEKMKLWHRFNSVFQQIEQEGVTTIIEIMRLREVSEDLITDYWEMAKKQIRITKHWNKLTPTEQTKKRKFWEKELKAEETELLTKLKKQEQNQKKKKTKTTFSQQEEPINPKNKVQCSECSKRVKKIDEENNLCPNCLSNYV